MITIKGQPKTVGELIDLLENYDRAEPFGFINQPIQDFVETDFGGVGFVETERQGDYDIFDERITDRI